MRCIPLLIVSAVVSPLTHAQSVSQATTIEGRLYDSGNPVGLGQASYIVNMKLEVFAQGSTCLLYSETHAVDVAGSATGAGFYALPLGNGTPTGATPFASFASSVVNDGATVSGCTPTLTLTNQPRVVRLSVQRPGDVSYTTLSPDTTLTSVPTALVAEKLGSKSSNDFIQVKDDASTDLNQTNVEYVFGSTNLARLKELLNPTAAITLSNQRLTNVANPTAAQDAATKSYADTKLGGQVIDLVDVAAGSGNGKVLTWDSAQSKWVAQSPTISGTAGGDLAGTYPNPTVAALAIGTSKMANDAITSAKINSTGIATNRLLITDGTTGARVNYATCANNEILRFVTGTGWQCTTVATLAPVTSVNGRTGAITLTAADITTGLGTAATRNIGTAAADVPELLTGGKLASATIPLLLGDVTGPIDANVVTKLQGRPLASVAPNLNEALRWNGSRWEPQAITDNGITALTGDISASGNGSVAATLTNGVVTTPKLFTNPGVNRLVATDGTTGATLSPLSCALNEVLQWQSGGWTCTAVATALGGSVVVPGGNTLGTSLSIGTKDAQALSLITNNTRQVTITSTGKVGIGTTSPSKSLSLAGSAAQTIGLEDNPVASAVGSDLTVQAGGSGTGIDLDGGSLILAGGSSTGNGRSAVEIQVARGGQGTGTTTRLANVRLAGFSGERRNISLGEGAYQNTGLYSVLWSLDNGTYTMSQDNAMAILGGNVGIGTTAPSRALHVVGALRLQTSTLPSTPASGDIAFQSGTLKYHNGSTWISVGAATGDFKADGSVPMTGQLQAKAGALASAGYSFAADADTGVYSPSADTLSIGTSGLERLRVDASGNVGIGTSSPLTRFEVRGGPISAGSVGAGTSGGGELRLYEMGAPGSEYVAFKAPDSLSANYTYVLPSTYGSSGQLLQTDGLGGLTWVSSSSSFPLRGPNSAASAPPYSFTSATTTGMFYTGSVLGLGTSGTGRIFIDGVGNVGIGTSAPTQKLDVNGGLNVTSAATFNNDASVNGILTFTGGAQANDGTQGSPAYTFTNSTTTGLFSPTVNTLALSSNGSERLRISSAGKVGMGLTNPAYPLDVVGDINSSGVYRLSSAQALAIGTSGKNTMVGNSAYTATGGSNNTGLGSGAINAMSVGVGNVAIGTSAMSATTAGSQNVSVGYLAGSNLNSTGNTLIGYGAGSALTSGSYNIVIGSFVQAPSNTSNNQLVIGGLIYGDLGTAKSIGIGVTSPRANLDVNGTILTPAPTDSGSTVDFAKGNLQFTTTACNSNTYTLNNIQNGGTYTLVVQNTTAGSCSFSASGFTVRPAGSIGPTLSGTHSMFSFTVVNSTIYVTWQSGL